MKKVLFALLLALAAATTSAIAAEPEPVSEKVKAAFINEFPGTEVIEWNNAHDFIKALFLFNGSRTEAYFSHDGELQATVRSIFYSQLPLAVAKTVDKKYPGADVPEVIEINNAEGTNYLLKLNTAARKYRLLIDSNGNFSSIEKIKK